MERANGRTKAKRLDKLRVALGVRRVLGRRREVGLVLEAIVEVRAERVQRRATRLPTALRNSIALAAATARRQRAKVGRFYRFAEDAHERGRIGRREPAPQDNGGNVALVQCAQRAGVLA